MKRLKAIYDFIYLQIVLWHSDKWTNWNRLQLKYAPLDHVEDESPKNPPTIPETPA